MLRKLRQQRPAKPIDTEEKKTRKRKKKQEERQADPVQRTEVITIRIPQSLHAALRVEAHEHHTSMNKLCISKLLQFIDTEMVPSEPVLGGFHASETAE